MEQGEEERNKCRDDNDTCSRLLLEVLGDWCLVNWCLMLLCCWLCALESSRRLLAANPPIHSCITRFLSPYAPLLFLSIDSSSQMTSLQRSSRYHLSHQRSLAASEPLIPSLSCQFILFQYRGCCTAGLSSSVFGMVSLVVLCF